MDVINHFYGKKGDKTMKRIISTILVCVLLLGCVFTLASCGKMISGTYSAKTEVAAQSVEVSYTFKGTKVALETKTTILGNVNTSTEEGKYSIDGDEITFTFEDKDGKEVSNTYTFEKGDGYIKIAGIEYKKK